MRLLVILLAIFTQLFAEDFLPSITFDGVNAITGTFSIIEEDIRIAGAEPLILKRIYSSGNNAETYRGWEFIPHLFLIKESERIIASEPSGARYIYTEAQENIYGIDFNLCGKGVLNCMGNLISARSNIKNHRAIIENKNHVKIHCSDKTERFYVRIDGSLLFYLEWEKLPNGNYTFRG